MANLAIKGHKERGKEVIEILEMLGGKVSPWRGNNPNYTYCVINGSIYINTIENSKGFQVFTLEQFLEKFPYRVGDKVLLSIGGTAIIKSMYWSNAASSVRYEMQGIDDYVFGVTTLQLYTEQEQETMEENKYRLDKSDDDKLATEVTCNDFKICAPDNYLIGKVTKVDGGMIVEYVKKQPQYPKTYEECCNVLGIIFDEPVDEEDSIGGVITSYEYMLDEKLWVLRKLLICRDAYWKIAGKEMGLGKPWEPDYKDGCIKYTITVAENEIYTDVSYMFSHVLIFPTKEIRDTFCKNFKELIEECKELL